MNFDKLQLKEHFRILQKRRKMVFTCTAITTIVVSILLLFSKAQYESSLALEVADDAITRLLTSDIDVSPDLTVGNYMDILTSQSFARRVVKSLSEKDSSASFIKKDRGKNAASSIIENFKGLLGFTAKSLSEQEKAVIYLLERMSTDHRGGSMIRVTVRSDNPDQAYLVARTVGEEFTGLHLKTLRDRIEVLSNFYQDQINRSYARLADSEDELVDFKRQNGITSTDRETARLTYRLDNLEAQLAEMSSQRKLAEKQVSTLYEQIENLQNNTPVLARLEMQLPRIDELKRRLLELQAQLNEQTAMYTSRHPKIQGLKREIETTIQELRGLAGGPNAPSESGQNDPVMLWHDLYIERLLSELELNNLRAKEESLENLVDDYRVRLLREVPEKEQEFVRLQRNLKVAQDSYQNMLATNEKVQSLEAEKALNVNIVEPAERPLQPMPRKRGLKFVAGIILGLTVGIGFAYLIEAFDRSVKTTKDVENQLRLPIAGYIFDYARKDDETKGMPSTFDDLINSEAANNVLMLRDPNSDTAENFRALRANTDFILSENPNNKVIMVTSPGPREGKSTVAINLAASYTLYGKRTLLLDTDIYHPTAHERLGVDKNVGLSNWLADEIAAETMHSSIQLNGSAMDVIPTGNRNITFQKLATNSKMQSLLAELRGEYDIIIIDAPPVILVSDPLLIAPHVDLVLLVIESCRTQTEAARNAAKLLQNAKAPGIHTVLNRLSIEDEYGPGSYFRSYRDGYQRMRSFAQSEA